MATKRRVYDDLNIYIFRFQFPFSFPNIIMFTYVLHSVQILYTLLCVVELSSHVLYLQVLPCYNSVWLDIYVCISCVVDTSVHVV